MIIDEWALLRYGIESVLRALRVQVVAQDRSGMQVGKAAADRQATLAVIGRPADIDAAELIRRLKALPHAPLVTALIPRGEEHRLPGVLAAGADAVLPRGTDPEELERALQRVTRGGRYVAGLAVAAMRSDVKDGPAIGDLTPREREILRYLAQQRSNQEIADELFVSVPTVKSHLRNIYEKLEVRSRHEAVKRAIEDGYLG